MSSRLIHRRFEELVVRLLEATGYSVRSIDPQSYDFGYDFEAIRGTEEWLVEIKYYRTTRAQISLLGAAAGRLAYSLEKSSRGRGMLIVSSLVPREMSDFIEGRHGIRVVDCKGLASWTASLPETADELAAMLGIDDWESFVRREGIIDRNSEHQVSAGHQEEIPASRVVPLKDRGRSGRFRCNQSGYLCGRLGSRIEFVDRTAAVSVLAGILCWLGKS